VSPTRLCTSPIAASTATVTLMMLEKNSDAIAGVIDDWTARDALRGNQRDRPRTGGGKHLLGSYPVSASHPYTSRAACARNIATHDVKADTVMVPVSSITKTAAAPV